MAKKILIVEDEAIIAIEIQSTLEHLGYQVAGIAHNGDQALDLLYLRQPDLALLDINIKGSKNGIDIANHIRKKYDLPFIFLTSYADKFTLDEAKKTIPYGYILKPFTENDLAVNIELALSKFEMEKNQSEWTIEYISSKTNIELTPKEHDILLNLKKGLKYAEIAEELDLSINTVKTYQKRLYQIFQVSTRQELMNKIQNA